MLAAASYDVEVMRILVAGASGLIGREVASLLKARGHFVRTLSRNAKRASALTGVADDVRLVDATGPGALRGVCDEIDVVCLP